MSRRSSSFGRALLQRAVIAVGCWLACAAGSVAAQEVTATVGPGPHYVGGRVEVFVTAKGFDPRLAMRPEAAPVTSGQLSFVGESRQQSVIFSMGDAGTLVSTVTYTYEFVPAKSGASLVGPFSVSQGDLRKGGVRVTSEPVKVAVVELPLTDAASVELELPSDATYVGARIPVTLLYRIAPDLHERALHYVFNLPIADMSDELELEADVSQGGQSIEISTSSGRLELRAQVDAEVVRGETWRRFTIPLFVTPRKPGLFSIGASSITVEAGVRFVNDLFGRRRATQTQRLRAADVPRALRVRALPLAGRPQSFAGAVGRGFALEATVDRSVVQVGEPITLDLLLRGEGALESLSFPPLDAAGLVPEESFVVRDAALTGQVGEGVKRFQAVIRVKSENVDAIPALGFSYFDPVAGEFETVFSRPIALSVRPARVIGAADVVAPREPREPGSGVDPSADPAAREGGASTAGGLRDLDLSIVADPADLLAAPPAGGGVVIPLACYMLSGGLLGLAWVLRRRADEDPAIGRLRAELREQWERVDRASGGSGRDAVVEMARALRAMRAIRIDADSRELDAWLASCDDITYAPSLEEGVSHADVLARGRELARALAGVTE